MSTQQPRDARASVRRAGDIARRYGREAAADRALVLFDAPFRTGTVVVIGEIKRGNSSLINGLLGHRDLLPVDVLTCTSAPIRLALTEGDRAPTAELVWGGRREAVSVADLPRWVTPHAPGDVELPSAAELTVSCPTLAGITLVDTPGVGGLDENTVTAALQEARNAGLLLMVCDASTPITRPEMDILARARDTVAGVIVAVTKTDKNVRRWRQIVADDRRLLREHLGGDIPVIGVSSLRALDAAEQSDPARRAEIAERSGITALQAAIRGLLAEPASLGERAALESMTATLRPIREGVGRDIRLYEGVSEAAAELERERAELEKFREQAAEWEPLFQRDIAVTRNQITDALDRDLEELKNNWGNRINSDGLRVLRTKSQVFTSQITLELEALMERTVGELIAAVTGHAEELFPDHPELVQGITAEALASIAPAEITGRDVEKKTKDLLDPSMVMMGMVGAGMLTAIIPVAPLAGATWIGVNMAWRAMRNGKQHLITWTRETTANMRVSTTRMLDTIIATARTSIMLQLRAQQRQRQRELQQRVEEARAAARESAEQRRERAARLRRNAEIIDATITELEAHLAAVPAAAPPGGQA